MTARKRTTTKKAVKSRAKAAKTAKKQAPSAKAKASKKKAAPVKKKSTAARKKAHDVKKSPPAAKKAAATEKKAAPKKAHKKAASPEIVPGKKPKALSRQFLIDLAAAVREQVLPVVGAAKGREIVGAAASGDATFQLDEVAEKALLRFLKSSKMPVAYYSEDAGYTTFTSAQPENLLVIDPIDGTRAAKSGFESCVICVASTRVIERPRMADVDNACVMEILGDRTFYAERGKGARIYVDGQYKRPKLSKNTDLETVAWSMTVPARPAELIFPTAARLIDLTSLKGGFFACNSTSYSLTRLLTNQLDACVDFANRFFRDIPDVVEDQFINAGRGIILGIAPYDLVASLLIAQEAGCTVTDAYGKSFDDVLLLDSSVGNQRSMVAAASRELHAKLMSFFNTRIRQFERLLERRAQKRD